MLTETGKRRSSAKEGSGEDKEIETSKGIGRSELQAMVSQILREEFKRIHPVWVERHLALLTTLRARFGNDIDKPIILAVIGQYMFSHATRPVSTYGEHLEPGLETHPSRLTNIESVATSTGIPRESVRRKVSELMEIGWLERDGHGGLVVTKTAAQELDAATQQVFLIQSRIFEEIAAAFADRGIAEFHRIDPEDTGGR